MTTSGRVFADVPTATGEVVVAAAPGELWPLVSNPLLLPAISTELQHVEWLDDTDAPAVGTRFKGHNRNPEIGEWTMVNTVIVCDPEREFAWAVGDPADPVAVWRFELEAVADGTVLRQSAQMGPGPSGITVAIERWPEKEERIVAHRLRQWEAGVLANLAEFKARAEAR